MDDWRVLLLFRVLAFDVGLAILLKIVSGKDQRQVRLVTQYVWSVIIVSLSSLYFGLPAVTTSSLLLLVLGALNGLAAYCTWRAMALSQSKNAALSQSSGILALPIAWVLLDEHHLLVQRLVLGGVLLGTVSWALFLAAERRQGMMAPIGQRAKTSRLLPWVAVYSLIWAVTAVAMRAYSLRAGCSRHGAHCPVDLGISPAWLPLPRGGLGDGRSAIIPSCGLDCSAADWVVRVS